MLFPIYFPTTFLTIHLAHAEQLAMYVGWKCVSIKHLSMSDNESDALIGHHI